MVLFLTIRTTRFVHWTDHLIFAKFGVTWRKEESLCNSLCFSVSSTTGSSAYSTLTKLRMLKTLLATRVFWRSATVSVILLGVVLRSIVGQRAFTGRNDNKMDDRRHVRNVPLTVYTDISPSFRRSTSYTINDRYLVSTYSVSAAVHSVAYSVLVFVVPRGELVIACKWSQIFRRSNIWTWCKSRKLDSSYRKISSYAYLKHINSSRSSSDASPYTCSYLLFSEIPIAHPIDL